MRISLFLTTVEVVTARKEEVEGAETHEMGILGPHTGTSTAARSMWSVSTSQNINGKAQSVIPQIEGVTSVWSCCLI